MILQVIAGEISVRNSCGGYTARHAKKTASCTMSREHCAIRVLEKVHGKRKTYYLSVPSYSSDGAIFYTAVSKEKS